MLRQLNHPHILRLPALLPLPCCCLLPFSLVNHSHACPVLAATGTVNVKCDKGSGWPTGVWDLRVQAAVEDGPCTDDGEITTKVKVNSKPTVTITGETSRTACAQGPVVLEFAVSVSGGDLVDGPYSATNIQAAVTGDTASGVTCGNPTLKTGERGINALTQQHNCCFKLPGSPWALLGCGLPLAHSKTGGLLSVLLAFLNAFSCRRLCLCW